jgi:hypothetical protein
MTVTEGRGDVTVKVDELLPLLPLPVQVTVTGMLFVLPGVTTREPDVPEIDNWLLEQLVAPVELHLKVDD